MTPSHPAPGPYGPETLLANPYEADGADATPASRSVAARAAVLLATAPALFGGLSQVAQAGPLDIGFSGPGNTFSSSSPGSSSILGTNLNLANTGGVGNVSLTPVQGSNLRPDVISAVQAAGRPEVIDALVQANLVNASVVTPPPAQTTPPPAQTTTPPPAQTTTPPPAQTTTPVVETTPPPQTTPTPPPTPDASVSVSTAQPAVDAFAAPTPGTTAGELVGGPTAVVTAPDALQTPAGQLSGTQAATVTEASLAQFETTEFPDPLRIERPTAAPVNSNVGLVPGPVPGSDPDLASKLAAAVGPFTVQVDQTGMPGESGLDQSGTTEFAARVSTTEKSDGFSLSPYIGVEGAQNTEQAITAGTAGLRLGYTPIDDGDTTLNLYVDASGKVVNVPSLDPARTDVVQGTVEAGARLRTDLGPGDLGITAKGLITESDFTNSAIPVDIPGSYAGEVGVTYSWGAPESSSIERTYELGGEAFGAFDPATIDTGLDDLAPISTDTGGFTLSDGSSGILDTDLSISQAGGIDSSTLALGAEPVAPVAADVAALGQQLDGQNQVTEVASAAEAIVLEAAPEGNAPTGGDPALVDAVRQIQDGDTPIEVPNPGPTGAPGEVHQDSVPLQTVPLELLTPDTPESSGSTEATLPDSGDSGGLVEFPSPALSDSAVPLDQSVDVAAADQQDVPTDPSGGVVEMEA